MIAYIATNLGTHSVLCRTGTGIDLDSNLDRVSKSALVACNLKLQPITLDVRSKTDLRRQSQNYL
ncbi:MAG TPA: hypothetical protein V6D12_12755, partial [Candidatus Obscuribacterales bacterium]